MNLNDVTCALHPDLCADWYNLQTLTTELHVRDGGILGGYREHLKKKKSVSSISLTLTDFISFILVGHYYKGNLKANK